jgi:hypothetical protein
MDENIKKEVYKKNLSVGSKKPLRVMGLKIPCSATGKCMDCDSPQTCVRYLLL